MEQLNQVVVFRPIPFVIGAVYPTYIAVEVLPDRPDGRPLPPALARMRARRMAYEHSPNAPGVRMAV